MKPMTEMSGEGDDMLLVYNGDIGVSPDDQAEHDAAAAHALMQVLSGTPFPDEILAMADELMREWGYSPEGGES